MANRWCNVTLPLSVRFNFLERYCGVEVMNFRDWDLNLKVRISGELLMGVLFWMYFPFMMLYFTDEFGKSLAGILMMVPPVMGVLANLFGGYWADRFGRKRMMVIALGVEVAALLVFAFSPSAWIDFAMFTILASAGSIYHPASSAMVADLVPVDKRRPVFAAFYTSMNVGVVLGPMLGAIFFYDYRRYLILGSALVALTFLLVMLKVVKETLPESSRKATEGQNVFDQVRNYGIIFKDKLFLFYIIAGIIIAQIFMQMDLYMGVYLKEFVPKQPLIAFRDWVLNIDGRELFGAMISVNGLLVVLFTLIVTKMIHKWSDRKALVISSCLFGLSFWLMAFSTNAWFLIGCMVLFTTAELIRTPVVQNFISKIAPENKRGQYMGASSLQFSVGRALAPLAVTMSQVVSPFGMFSFFLFLGLVSAGIYWIMFSVYEKQSLTSNMQLIDHETTNQSS